jgi:hypothetical protein
LQPGETEVPRAAEVVAIVVVVLLVIVLVSVAVPWSRPERPLSSSRESGLPMANFGRTYLQRQE